MPRQRQQRHQGMEGVLERGPCLGYALMRWCHSPNGETSRRRRTALWCIMTVWVLERRSYRRQGHRLRRLGSVHTLAMPSRYVSVKHIIATSHHIVLQYVHQRVIAGEGAHFASAMYTSGSVASTSFGCPGRLVPRSIRLPEVNASPCGELVAMFFR